MTNQEQQNHPEQMLDNQLGLALDRSPAPWPWPISWGGRGGHTHVKSVYQPHFELQPAMDHLKAVKTQNLNASLDKDLLCLTSRYLAGAHVTLQPQQCPQACTQLPSAPRAAPSTGEPASAPSASVQASWSPPLTSKLGVFALAPGSASFFCKVPDK